MSTTAFTSRLSLKGAREHPARFARDKAILLGAALLLAHIGTLAVSGLYYLCLETVPAVKHTWDGLFTVTIHVTTASNWDYTRHLLRDVGEGFLGGFLAQGIVWNHYTRKHQRYTERVNMRMLATRPPLAILFAVPGFVGAVLVVAAIHHLSSDAHTVAHAAGIHASLPHTTYWDKVRSIWTGSWDKKLIGLSASFFFGRRPMKKLFDAAQLWFAEERVMRGKRLRWWHTPNYRDRYDAAQRSAAIQHMLSLNSEKSHYGAVRGVMIGSTVVLLALAAFGYYVLTFIA